MKEGDLIKFRYKEKIKYGYIIGMYDLNQRNNIYLQEKK